jgi:hypothetical protein
VLLNAMRIIILILETLSQQLTKRGERRRSKIQAVSRFSIYKYGGKTRIDGIRCEIFLEKIGIQNLLIELKE